MTLLVTALAVLLAFALMAVGVVLRGKRLRGSCGGEGSADCHCERVGVPEEDRACERLKRGQKPAASST